MGLLKESFYCLDREVRMEGRPQLQAFIEVTPSSNLGLFRRNYCACLEAELLPSLGSYSNEDDMRRPRPMRCFWQWV